MAATFSIGQVARQFGLSSSGLRYYESLGLIPEPERVRGRRRYGPEALDRLAMIDVAQRAGFTLKEVRVLLDGLQAEVPPTAEWRELAARKLSEIDELLARTAEMRSLIERSLACECLTLEDIEDFRRANAAWARAQRSGSPLESIDPLL